MASCFFLMRQFEDVNIYLNSIKAYMYNDDDFNYNYALSLASTRNYKGAEEALLLIHNERYKAEYFGRGAGRGNEARVVSKISG